MVIIPVYSIQTTLYNTEISKVLSCVVTRVRNLKAVQSLLIGVTLLDCRTKVDEQRVPGACIQYVPCRSAFPVLEIRQIEFCWG